MAILYGYGEAEIADAEVHSLWTHLASTLREHSGLLRVVPFTVLESGQKKRAGEGEVMAKKKLRRVSDRLPPGSLQPEPNAVAAQVENLIRVGKRIIAILEKELTPDEMVSVRRALLKAGDEMESAARKRRSR